MKLSILAVIAAIGCQSIIPAGRSASEECKDLDDSYLAWKATAIASSGLAGATGASGVLTASIADEPGADIGLAASSTLFGILATVAEWLSGEYASRAAKCAVEGVP